MRRSELALEYGNKNDLARRELGGVLNYYNVVTTAVCRRRRRSVRLDQHQQDGQTIPAGFFNRHTNPGRAQLAIGGICEDAMNGDVVGHRGVRRTYRGGFRANGAFGAPLGHIAARLHAIGNQARVTSEGGAYRPFFLICAHAGLKTGEDGPTHADPQSLQLLQDNFPLGTMITLTPWDPQEVWFLVSAALAKRPAIIAPFVTRPPELVLDRAAHGLPSAALAAQGVYRLRAAHGHSQGTIVLQGTGVTNAFVTETLPLINNAGLSLNVYVITSSELFDLLPPNKREEIFPEVHQQDAMGITDFTMATMIRWVRSDRGRAFSLHPFRHNHFLGSGSGTMVMSEAGLDGRSQFQAIRNFIEEC